MAATGDKHAPELPVMLVERLLASHAREGDVATLCSAACVARSWRAAAAQPTLWLRMVLSRPGLCERTTFERLDALLRRSLLPVGGPPHIEFLDVSHCALSPEDVLRALNGRRISQIFWLRRLRLSDNSKANAEAVLENLRAAVVPYATMDVHTTCRIGELVNPGTECYNLCDHTGWFCWTCNIWACIFCKRAVRQPICEHQCSSCSQAHDDVAPCDANHHRADEQRFCESCRIDCSACERHLCIACDEVYTCCTECEAVFCRDCHDPKDDVDEFYCDGCEDIREVIQTERDRAKEADERDAWEEDGYDGRY
jgi:hypothetical protein